MKIEESGIVLRVKNYEACLDFYAKILELKIRYQKEGLTNFQFGSAYLVIEKGDPMPEAIRHVEYPPLVLRLNVQEVNQAIWLVRAKGVEAEFRSFDWGNVGRMYDPDGNLVEFCKWK